MTRTGPCLAVDRLRELTGKAAEAWVRRHPSDAAINDLGVIADVDGRQILCLGLAPHPVITLTSSPGGAGGTQVQRRATLHQLTAMLADPLNYGAAAPTWFLAVTFYRWHYDQLGRVDTVTAFWTP